MINPENNGLNRFNVVAGGVATPFNLLANDKNISKNEMKPKKNVFNHDMSSNTNFSSSPSIQSVNRYPVRASDLGKVVEPCPSYTPPKPIITDIERSKPNKSPLNTISTIAEEPCIVEPAVTGKGDAWETLKELSSSVPPPPPDSDHSAESHLNHRPLTIVSPTGVQETNLDDITPPLPPRDHSISRPPLAKNVVQKSHSTQNAYPFSSPITSKRTLSLTETNESAAHSRDSLDDLETTQATSIRGTGRPSSVDESSLYHSSSSSASLAPMTDAETTYGGLTRTDLDTPSPAFYRNSGGSASLQWVYPNPENGSEAEQSFVRTHNKDDYCLFVKQSNNGSFGPRGRSSSKTQTDGQKNSKKHYNHHNHNHNHSNPSTQTQKQSNFKSHGSLSGSYKSDASSGTNSARRRHKNMRRDRSKDDDDINVPLLNKNSFCGRTAASDTEEEFDLNLMGAASAYHRRVDVIRRSPSFESNSSHSQRKGSLPDYYKSNSNSKYGKIMPKKLPSMESVSKAIARDSFELTPKLKSKGSLPVIPLQELRNVNEVLNELGYKKDRGKTNDELRISFEEEEEKNLSNTDVLIASNKDNQSEHELIKSRALNSKADTLLDMNSDLVELENQFFRSSRPTGFRFPLEDINFGDNRRQDVRSKSNANPKNISELKATKESEYDNLHSDDFPFYEGDNEDEDNQLTDDRLVTDDSDDVHSEDQSFDESNRLFDANCDESVAALDGVSVMNDAGLTDAEGALSDVNSLLNDGHDMDDTSMSSRSGASSRMLDNIDAINLMYDSEFESYPAANRQLRPDILSDDDCFNIGHSSDLNIDYMSVGHPHPLSQPTHSHQLSATNIVTPNTLAERLENIRAITNNITRNFGQTKPKANETDDSEA